MKASPLCEKLSHTVCNASRSFVHNCCSQRLTAVFICVVSPRVSVCWRILTRDVLTYTTAWCPAWISTVFFYT